MDRKLLDKFTQGLPDGDMLVQVDEVLEKARVTLHERRCFDALLSDRGLRMVQACGYCVSPYFNRAVQLSINSVS